jgi:hypothetical protein
MANEKTFGARRQQHARARFIDGRARRFDAFHRKGEFVKWLVAVPGRILDGEAGDAGIDGAANIGRHAGRLTGIAPFEIGVHRHIARRGDLADMGQHGLEAQRVIGEALCPGSTGTRGGKRLESQMLQVAGRADIPRVGNDKAARFMQASEGSTFGSGCGGQDNRSFDRGWSGGWNAAIFTTKWIFCTFAAGPPAAGPSARPIPI